MNSIFEDSNNTSNLLVISYKLRSNKILAGAKLATFRLSKTSLLKKLPRVKWTYSATGKNILIVSCGQASGPVHRRAPKLAAPRRPGCMGRQSEDPRGEIKGIHRQQPARTAAGPAPHLAQQPEKPHRPRSRRARPCYGGCSRCEQLGSRGDGRRWSG